MAERGCHGSPETQTRLGLISTVQARDYGHRERVRAEVTMVLDAEDRVNMAAAATEKKLLEKTMFIQVRNIIYALTWRRNDSQ